MTPETCLGPLGKAVAARLKQLEKEDVVPRFWRKDFRLWNEDPAKEKEIQNRLGWLTAFETMEARFPEILRFANDVRRDGFRHAVLLGMGGSSLCPDVLRSVFQPKNSIGLHVLDSTDPEAVRGLERRMDLDRTLFIVASKSGTTAEIVAFTDYFFGKKPEGDRFVAITDPGTALEKEAHAKNFRKIFLNPPDIGGRFSALSLFGLVPAALLGIDLKIYFDRAKEMVQACRKKEDNPGLWLGAVLAEAALHGRDKLTLFPSPGLALLGDWIEQLVAESTGKNGQGILPVAGEPMQEAKEYGSDRIFVFIQDLKSKNGGEETTVRSLSDAGHPVLIIDVPDPIALGAEFFRWEFATTVASTFLRLYPFDEPDVQRSKELTQKMLREFETAGRLPGEWVPTALSKPLLSPRKGEFVTLLAFLPPTDEVRKEFQILRQAITKKYRVATTLGFGPRYLHSIGQYYKGGPNRGHFLFFTCEDRELPIPGRKYGFSVLKQAQALGDMEALKTAGRHVLPFHVRGDLLPGLKRLRSEIERVL